MVSAVPHTNRGTTESPWPSAVSSALHPLPRGHPLLIGQKPSSGESWSVLVFPITNQCRFTFTFYDKQLPRIRLKGFHALPGAVGLWFKPLGWASPPTWPCLQVRLLSQALASLSRRRPSSSVASPGSPLFSSRTTGDRPGNWPASEGRGLLHSPKHWGTGTTRNQGPGRPSDHPRSPARSPAQALGTPTPGHTHRT